MQIGLQAIARLEQLHSVEYVHGDLKLENLALESGQEYSVLSSNIILGDFCKSGKMNEAR